MSQRPTEAVRERLGFPEDLWYEAQLQADEAITNEQRLGAEDAFGRSLLGGGERDTFSAITTPGLLVLFAPVPGDATFLSTLETGEFELGQKLAVTGVADVFEIRTVGVAAPSRVAGIIPQAVR